MLGPDQHWAATLIGNKGTATHAIFGEQIECEAARPQVQMRLSFGMRDECAHHFPAGGISECVNDAMMAVAPFTTQNEFTR